MSLWNWFEWSQISVVLDVLLVSCLIYAILVLVRGTRALPMLAGLGIIVLIYLVSRVLNLNTLHWILDNFLSSVILVVVVLFQDDLRRALIKVGLGPGFGSVVPQSIEHCLAEIAKAAAELSTRRLGALIVIKRNVGIEDYTEDAVELNAKVSHQLLVSLFLRTSPLHDGAVVIDGDRVLAAGAVLPLTFNPTVSGTFGTRHRAAIGLSERTDAVMVIVSEETGIISLVREGRITRDLDEKSLYNALYRLIAFRARRAQNRIRSRLGLDRLRRLIHAREFRQRASGEPNVQGSEVETNASSEQAGPSLGK